MKQGGQQVDQCSSSRQMQQKQSELRDSLGMDPDAGKDWGKEENGATEDEMVG